jgi:hypothetical protein
MKHYKRCVMIMADGARPDVFEELAWSGELPNIKKHLIDPGCLKHGVTSFPSTTGPAYMPYLTGCHPGTCNVPGIRWFDKTTYARKPWSRNKFRSYVGVESFLLNSDMKKDLRTLFELSDHSINIFSSVNRGVPSRGNKTSFFRMWNWYYAHLTDRWAYVDLKAGRSMVKGIHEDPEFMFVLFPGIDVYSHIGTPFNPEVTKAYKRIDDSIGQLVEVLQKKGWLDESILMIVSDHGLSTTHSHLGVNQFLEQRGVKTFYYPVIFKKGFEAAHMVSGNGMSHLYFPHSNGSTVKRADWEGRCYEEDMSARQRSLLDELLEQDAVDLIATQERDGSIIVRKGSTRARIQRRGDKIHYDCLDGNPLAYEGHAKTMSLEESLQVSHGTDYPDAPAQLLQIFQSSRCGDAILSAAPGYDLRDRYEIHEHKGSHGSLHRDHMLVPLISNIPLNGQACRSVDIFPTVCRLMGKSWPHQIDGQSRL